MIVSNLKEEKRLRKRGFRVIAGVDEVGRGSLAGPVTGGACCITDFSKFTGSCEARRVVRLVKDSKALTAGRREALFKALAGLPFFEISVRRVGPKEIDRTNIRRAALKAMKKAVSGLSRRPDVLLVDGIDEIPGLIDQRTYIKGDERIFIISAASIAAKVTRDGFMARLARKYPAYGFELHKGYGTKLHRARLRRFGASSVHRRSFSPLRFSVLLRKRFFL